ncbi:hypothetical protein AB1Y20_004181 [Prymnesium parvum]|uniref:Peroxidase n=1 Tax=Prymnesium parvum TaxID=97485 RepID=A0AB34J935_PRYPA
MRSPPFLLLLLHAAATWAFPTYMTCDRPLVVGHVIMGQAAVETSALGTSFQGKECGGTFTAGEALTLEVSGGGTYLIEVTGAKLTASGSTCDGRRLAHLGGSASTFAVTATAGSSVVEAWIGRGTGPTSADMPVQIHAKCTLTAAAATAAPPTAAAPPPTVGPPSALSPPPVAAPTPSAVPMPAVSGNAAPISSVFCFNKDCAFMVGLSRAPGVDDFLDVTLRHRGSAWLGVGISPDGRMGADALGIISTWRSSTQSQSSVYRLSGRTPTDIVAGWQRAFNVKMRARHDGTTTVVVRLPYSDSCAPGELVICRTGFTTLMAVHGFGEELGRHDGQVRIEIHGNTAYVVRPVWDWDVVVHVTCMCIAWLFCAPLAVTLARLRHLNLFRPWLTSTRRKGGKQLWFLVHRNCMMTACLLTIFGGILILVRLEFHFYLAHQVVGLVTLSLAVIQTLAALGRPKPGTKHHHSWSNVHKFLGITTLILAVCAGLLGADVLSRRLFSDLRFSSEIDGRGSDAICSTASPQPAPPPPPLAVFKPPPPLPVPSSSTVTPQQRLNAVKDAARYVEELLLTDITAGPSFIRLAWHDAATYDAATRKYGPRASMRFDPEASDPSNKGLSRPRALLQPIKEALPMLSYADLWQLAAVVSIEMMGGPKVPFRIGRIDATSAEDSAPPGRLPGAHDSAADLRRVFYRMGFNDRDIVALSGAHSVGICRTRNSGFRGPWDTTAFRFDNKYFIELLDADRWQDDGKQWNSVVGDGTMMLDADIRMSTDPQFVTWSRLFATNELVWFSAFSEAFQKLGELGHTPSTLIPAEYVLKTVRSGGLQAVVSEAALRIQQIVRTHHVGPAFIRLAWHDAGTYNSTDGKYGPRASMRFEPEASNPSNNGLDRARAMLEPVKRALPLISYADLWQLAAVVSIEMMGGPRVPFRVGRLDATSAEECAPPGMLPDAHGDAAHLRKVFYRMGFNDGEIVALIGSHSVGRCHPQFSGFNGPWTTNPLSFDNHYFKDLLQKHWAPDGNVYKSSISDGTIMLDADLELATDPTFSIWVRAFANDQTLFFSSFASAFQKLGDLGHSSLQEADYTLAPVATEIQENPEAGSVCLKHLEGKCSVNLRWEYFSQDNSVAATLDVSQPVGWLALGVSKTGRMVFPDPSYAVVCDPSACNKHVLRAQDITSQSRTAPLDASQDLRDASFERSNGFSRLRFRTSLSWFTRYAQASGGVHFLYAHSSLGDASVSFGYHGIQNRGNKLVAPFGQYRYILTSEVEAQVQTATGLIAELVRKLHAGPTLVRLAWHDAGTFNSTDGKYGPRASMRFEPEASNPSNNGLDRARALLEPIKLAVPLISYADLWQLAAVVSIEMMGGPRVPFRVGRRDATSAEECAPPGMLPDAHGDAAHLRKVFYRMGFNDGEIVALVGAHTLGRCHPQFSGFNGPWTTNPLSFDNQFFITLLNSNFSYSGTQWDTESGTMMLNADMTFKSDPDFRNYSDLYASDQSAFFDDFSAAFSKLGELGWSGLAPVSYTIPEPAVNISASSDTVQLKPGMVFTWTLGADGNVSATVTLNAIVGWLALAVSESGRMVNPTPSFAVVGSNAGVRKHRLINQDPVNVAHTAPVEAVQDLLDTSFARADGKTILRFRTSLEWFTQYAATNNGAAWFIFAHAPPPDPDTNFGYHGLNRGNYLINGFGLAQPPSPPTAPPQSPQPPPETKSVSVGSNLRLNWIHDMDTATTTISLRLEQNVQWLAFAVSEVGQMITPQPSRAVVGSSPNSVLKRTLIAKDMSAISTSAPVDEVQDLVDPSFEHVDGATVLKFTVAQSYLTQFTSDESVTFLYSHGEVDVPTSRFSYHGPRRGVIRIPDFLMADDSGGGSTRRPSPPPPPRPPSSLSFTLQQGVQASVALVGNSAASFEVVVHEQVPWVAIAVSHSGWMIDPEPSKAVVGDVTTSTVTKYKLMFQNPSSPAQSVSPDLDDAALSHTSISYADGITILRFRAPLSWLTAYVGDGSSAWLLWAHGGSILPRSFPSYHVGHRGARPLFLSELQSKSPPPASLSPPSPASASPCTGDGGLTDYCGESLAYNVAKCYVSSTSLTPPEFDKEAEKYDHVAELAAEFRLAWTIAGGYPDGEITIMMQARTLGWVGFGLMSDMSDGHEDSGHGMIRTDIYIGHVVNGNATVQDSWSPSVAAPISDGLAGRSDDVYNVGGYEDIETGKTTIWFTRKLVTNDTWDYDIGPDLELPCVYAYSRKNVDSFNHYHGPTRGFSRIVLLPSDPPPDYTIIPVIIAVLIFTGVLMWLSELLKRRVNVAMRRAAELAALQKQVDASVDSAGTFSFGMVLVNAADFLQHGKFVPFETLRDAAQLKVLDTVSAAEDFAEDRVIIFFSHQWLGWDSPDPEGVHYRCIEGAVKQIARQSELDLKDVWVWLDYSCMPQQNPTTLSLAVSDLSEVAALASYFVVVTPTTTHTNTLATCDTASYQSRGWCRLEQFSYVCTGNTEHMFIVVGDGTAAFEPYISQPSEWKRQALLVLQGQFTCCHRTSNHTIGEMPCDKDQLKPAILRMYMKAICYLPDCPLRDQLIQRDRDIISEDHFDKRMCSVIRQKRAALLNSPSFKCRYGESFVFGKARPLLARSSRLALDESFSSEPACSAVQVIGQEDVYSSHNESSGGSSVLQLAASSAPPQLQYKRSSNEANGAGGTLATTAAQNEEPEHLSLTILPQVGASLCSQLP